MSFIFLAIYNFFSKQRALFWVSLILISIWVIFFGTRIRLEEDITKFIPKGKEVEEVNKVFANLNLKDRLIVKISQADSLRDPDPDKLIAVADTFVNRLSKDYKEYIAKIISNDAITGVYDYILNHLPLFLESKDYKEIELSLNDKTVGETLENNKKNLTGIAGFALKPFIISDPLHFTIYPLNRLKTFQVGENFEMRGGHVFSKDQKNLLIFINTSNPSSETFKNGKLIDGIDSIIGQITKKDPTVFVNYFGSPAVSVSNARQLKSDTMLTLTIAVIVIVLFISFAFRKKFISLFIIIPVLFGMLFSLALMYFIKGQISVVAVGAGSVVFGIGLSYSIHLFNHFRHTQSVPDVIKDLSNPMTIGSFTTIAAFLSLLYVSSEALQDFGLFSALSLLGTILFCLIVMPHFLRPSKEKTHEPNNFILYRFIDKLNLYGFERHYWIIIVLIIISVVFWYTSRKTGFDSDMMNLNYTTERLQKAETELNNIQGESDIKPVYLVTTGKTLDEALKNQGHVEIKIDSLQKSGLIKHFASPRSFLSTYDEQQEKIKHWQNFWTEEKKARLKKTMIEKGKKLGFKETSFNTFFTLLDSHYQPVDMLGDEKFKALLFGDWINKSAENVMVISKVNLRPRDKDTIYTQLLKANHTVVFDKQYFAKKFVNLLNSDFYFVLFACSFLVFATMLFSYGRIELTLMTFLPMAISWLWILGIMGIFGIKFNIINIIIATFIFGLGDDFSIFIMDGLLQEYKTGKRVLASHKNAIFLSAFTTIVGVGVLIFAKHPALKSIAAISIIGILSVVLIAYTIQPFLFRIFIGRTNKNRFPFILKSFALTVFAFTYFVMGCFLLSFIGLVIFWLLPLRKSTRKVWYHFVLQQFTKSLVYIMMNVKKNIINENKEDFKKPAIIIANHQSFLDILTTLMLSPKSIMVTNKWVWNSPVFGRIVKLGGFFPVEKGVESGIDYFDQKLKEGFSIIIFPEGTRQPDCVIKRFHKGAFYLAEKLKVDILPVIIHGHGDAMTKGDDFYLKNSCLSLKILKRITPDDTTFGTTYQERTKKINQFFRDQYEILKTECSTPANPYFKYKLIKNYVYKGPVLEWYMRFKLKMERDYEQFHRLIPLRASVVDIGCGYGFMSYMLGFMSEYRTVLGIDYDKEKIEVANQCFSKDERFTFVSTDALSYSLPKSDVFVLSDVLHYLPYDKQKQLIARCIDNLNPKGMVIIRDGDSSMQKKHRLTKLTEIFSTRLFAFNKTEGELHFTSRQAMQDIVAGFNMKLDLIQNDKHTSNVIFVISGK